MATLAELGMMTPQTGAEFVANSPPQGRVLPIPIIRNSYHLNQLIRGLESDDQQRALVEAMRKQGLFVPKFLLQGL